MIYLRARWYNPTTGRFLTRDPIDAGHKYAYANSDPVNRVDPTGLGVKTAAFVLGTEVLVLEELVAAAAATAVPTFTEVAVGATGRAILVSGITAGFFTAVGADFICIMKTATDAGLQANGILSNYFDLDLRSQGYSNGCRVQSVRPVIIDDNYDQDSQTQTGAPPVVPPHRRPTSVCGPNEEYHHLLPWDFRSWFARMGIDVNDPEFLVCMDDNVHRNLHDSRGGNWNQRWQSFINRVGFATIPEILVELARLRAELGPLFPGLAP